MRISSLTNNPAVLLSLATLIWSGNAVAGKFAVGHISPMMLTCARWTIAAAFLITISNRHLRKDWPVIRTRLPFLFLMGASGYAVFNGLLYTSLKYTTAINVTIVQGGMPMFIFVLNFLAFQTRLHWGQIAGYGLTLAGVLLTAAAGDFSTLADLDINRGDLIMLVAALIYAGYSVGIGAKPQVHWLSFLTALVTCASITSFFMAGYEFTTQDFLWPHTVTGWSVVAYTAIFPSILSQAFYIRGIELLGGNKAGLYLNLVPIFGALLAVLLLGEVLYAYHAVALALVVGGILLAQRLQCLDQDRF